MQSTSADAADWGIGAFETVGSGLSKASAPSPKCNKAGHSWALDTLSDYVKEIPGAFAIIAAPLGRFDNEQKDPNAPAASQMVNTRRSAPSAKA
jgi:putative intracellular protease/amidase